MNFFKINSYVHVCALYLLLITQVQAQTSSFVEFLGNTEVFIKPGGHKTVTLTFLINEKYHIQGAFIDNEYLIPTRLTFTSKEEIVIGSVQFPAPHKFWMASVDEPLEVFSNKLEIKVPLEVSKSSKRGVYPMKGSLYYQACDSVKCYYPRNLDFEVKVLIQ